ncbi:cytochrome d ubiquinol oxidase subunit II, partial [Klebsiella pneumoniae]|nr:cytochrome d ubiquinol oxidase subunit II [Klebsiella pneumoniae]
LATFSQGVAVGPLLNGLRVSGRTFSGSALVWLAPFPLFCGLGLVLAYALLGCTWLMKNTEDSLHRGMSELATPLTLGLLAVIAIISVWT